MNAHIFDTLAREMQLCPISITSYASCSELSEPQPPPSGHTQHGESATKNPADTEEETT